MNDGAGGVSSPPLVTLERITKRFPGVLANDAVDLELRTGEVHALIGENGAGKSTLMRVLYGMYPADEGRIFVRGGAAKIASPRDAIALGIGMVHQHFVLVEYIGDDVAAFNDPVKGEALSTAMYDDGAEIIYHASGASGAGLFNAAVEANKLAIGVDSDQYLTASPEQQPLILTSMLKRVDTAVYNAIEASGAGTFGGSFVFGMAESGVDYATSNPEQLTADITTQLDEFKQQIIDGTIVVPETPA